MIKHLPDNASGNFVKLRNSLITSVGKAIGDYNMIEEGDTVLVCMSGGKDSHAMLMILLALQERAPISFKLIAMSLDQKQPGFPADVLPRYFEQLGIDYRIVEADTYSVVKEKIPEGKTTCSLCSRLRRGIIYTTAKELGANKIALGHHRDDIVETLFLNMFFGAKLKAMPPKLATNDKQNVVIRPLAYCSEKDIASYARQMQFPIIPCDLCGSQENLQRQKVKDMLQAWEREQPGRINNIFRAITNVEPSHLADYNLYDFKSLSQAKREDEDPLFGDIASEGAALSIALNDGKRIEFTRN
ncbi:MAG TPA: tRNA 2-thiocytidine(32) synthetase TtcA [Methylotenera sp.]|nr:tRNA 2-thiocytidine(32) synthetase TtcA [Methylotenera sp.]HPV44781.1 tRNA 2-thiocytidine(32) synthetase TtcA [Methylotenera sp.]